MTFVRTGLFTIFILVGTALLHGYAPAQPHPIPQGTPCSECSMLVDGNSKFVAVVVDITGRDLFFCDIGDMLIHFTSKKNMIRSVQVKDYATGEWIDGKSAFYVRNKEFHTPMSWGIAAHRKDADAKKWGSPVDFNGAFKLLK